MSRRDLYRSVLCGDSPQLVPEMSPVANLACSLHDTTLTNTPRRKLSLSSSYSDSSIVEVSPLVNGFNDSVDNICATLNSVIGSDKENQHNCSPSRSLLNRVRSNPFKELQNVACHSDGFSPLKKVLSPNKRVLSSPFRLSTLDEVDSNSQDSGYSESAKKNDDRCFNLPLSFPRHKLNLDLSPPKVTIKLLLPSLTPIASPKKSEIRTPFRKFFLPEDDEDTLLMDLVGGEGEEEPPMGFSALLSAPIKSSPSVPVLQTSTTEWGIKSLSLNNPRLPIRRCLSMMDTSTPTSSRIASLGVSFKRPQPPCESPSAENKRRRVGALIGELSPLLESPAGHRSPLGQRQVSAPDSGNRVPRPKFQRSHSESHVSIMKALNKSSNHNGQLTGDFSKPLSLPVLDVSTKHPDLKSISVHTMANLIEGKFEVSSFQVVDCRYPYEFCGGHISGAVNWSNPQMAIDCLAQMPSVPNLPCESAHRHLLIFHCEFSAERGPKMQKMLRQEDRNRNKEQYPALHFPEMYLLEGGYKAFYESYPNLCSPGGYVPMLHEKHVDDLRHFRGKSKSWAAENRQSKGGVLVPRSSLKHLGL